jgi:hypothetical protein
LVEAKRLGTFEVLVLEEAILSSVILFSVSAVLAAISMQ